MADAATLYEKWPTSFGVVKAGALSTATEIVEIDIVFLALSLEFLTFAITVRH